MAAVQRFAGYILLALALPLTIWRDGPGFGTLLWACLAMAAALVVTFMLSWCAHWFRPFARLAPSSSPNKPSAKRRPQAESPKP